MAQQLSDRKGRASDVREAGKSAYPSPPKKKKKKEENAPERNYSGLSESVVAQSCLTLCNPMDCSLPGSSTHGIFQARILECTPKRCKVVSKNLRSTETEVPPNIQGFITGPATNYEGWCFLVEPGGRWLRSSHLCHPKLKDSLQFSSILPNNCLLAATWWSFLELPLRYCRNFPGGPVAETLHSHCRGPALESWSGN